jgi:triosephosphate isomerase
MRRPFIVGNWKLHQTIAEALELVTQLKNAVASVRDVDVAVAPPFTALAPVARRLEGSHISLAAQDCFWEDSGAWTGQVSAPLLRDAGCAHVIVGHSERRQHFGETDEGVGRKVRAVLRAAMQPIVCVGETERERDAGATFAVVERQLGAAIGGLAPEELRRLAVAYEPVWAIGTGRTATAAQAEEVQRFLRERMAGWAGAVAGEVRILYGGSVKPDNAAGLMAEPDVDGALVGGASLDAEGFARIVRYRRS